jgi:hypothetical protein
LLIAGLAGLAGLGETFAASGAEPNGLAGGTAGDGGVAAASAPATDTPTIVAPGPGAPAVAPTVPGRRPRAAPAKPALDYDLRPVHDGTGDLVYEESSFVARVSVDGVVSFRDKGRKLSFWPPFLPVKRATPGVPSLQASLSALVRGRKPPATEGEPPPDDSYLIIPQVTPYRPDPREGCPSCNAFQPFVLPLNVTGKLDLTEELIRFSGGDPHRIEKARFLTATRERRIRMAVSAHADWIRRATAELPARLEEIACDERRSRGERRAILRALRDEMNGSPEGRAAAAAISERLDRFDSPDAGEGCPGRGP